MKNILKLIALLGIIWVSIWAFNYFSPIRVAIVQGDSMSPTLHDGSRVFIHRSYDVSPLFPKRGDIIVFIDKDNVVAIKRVALVPGDRDTISPTGNPNLSITDRFSILGTDQYVVLGDNTNNSYDSRFYGPIRRSQILGVAK